MSRKTAREYAFKLTFELLFNTEEVDDNKRQEMMQDATLNERNKQYVDRVVDGIKEHYIELIELISNNAHNFNINRIFKPDLAGLLVACYEMRYMSDEIPMSVSINEIVELIKMYSTEKSSIFVNGVLAGVYRQLQNQK